LPGCGGQVGGGTERLERERRRREERVERRARERQRVGREVAGRIDVQRERDMRAVHAPVARLHRMHGDGGDRVAAGDRGRCRERAGERDAIEEMRDEQRLRRIRDLDEVDAVQRGRLDELRAAVARDHVT